MAESDVPQGQRFSLVYLRRDEQLEDSERMRRRLGKEIDRRLTDYRGDSFHLFFLQETGLPDKSLYGWSDYLCSLQLRDVLDTIPLIVSYWRKQETERRKIGSYYPNYAEAIPPFIAECRRIFAEEQARYSIDDRGGVHLKVDEQFEVTRAAAVLGMGNPRYAAALASLEAGFRALDGVPPDGREAIRDVFGAAESVFKQTFGVQRLAGQFIDKQLRPAVAALPWNQEALAAGSLMCDGLVSWVAAAHKYRHEHGRPDPHQPPLDLAVLMVSQGTAFVRWLVTVDQAVVPAP